MSVACLYRAPAPIRLPALRTRGLNGCNVGNIHFRTHCVISPLNRLVVNSDDTARCLLLHSAIMAFHLHLLFPLGVRQSRTQNIGMRHILSESPGSSEERVIRGPPAPLGCAPMEQVHCSRTLEVIQLSDAQCYTSLYPAIPIRWTVDEVG